MEVCGENISPEVLTHLKRELMHAVWELLLSGDFVEAYKNGIKIKCYDGVERLVFPRIFIYGADYPEKYVLSALVFMYLIFFRVLLATIKNIGTAPCPRCEIKKDDISAMGTKADMDRRIMHKRQDTPFWHQTVEKVRIWIFEKGIRISGSAVDRALKQYSWVPTRVSIVSFGFH